jgi:hypothetical protein
LKTPTAFFSVTSGEYSLATDVLDRRGLVIFFGRRRGLCTAGLCSVYSVGGEGGAVMFSVGGEGGAVMLMNVVGVSY